MLDRVRPAVGELFPDVRSYVADVNQYWSRISDFLKLERAQHFQEPGDPSWEMFTSGDWEGSLRIQQRNRHLVAAEFAEDARHGFGSRRVRVVEFPITPYLQWELHALLVRAEYGEQIRVVTAETLAPHESSDPAPELIFLGELAMYEVRYDGSGALCGGRKFTDPDLLSGCRAEVEVLYRQGEDLAGFFTREIAPLPPPGVETSSDHAAG